MQILLFVILLTTSVLSVAAGWTVNGWRLQAQISDIQKQIADANAEAAQNLTAANLLGNQLSDSLIASQEKHEATTTRIMERIKYVEKTTPAKCDLSNVRVLINTAISNQDSEAGPTAETGSSSK